MASGELLGNLVRDHAARKYLSSTRYIQDSPLTVFAVNYDGQQGEVLIEQADKLGIAFELLEQDPAPNSVLSDPAYFPPRS